MFGGRRMRVQKIRTAVLYRQVTNSATASRAKEAFCFGGTTPCGARAVFELRNSNEIRFLIKHPAYRAYDARMNAEAHIVKTHRGGTPSSLSRNNYVALAGPNSG